MKPIAARVSATEYALAPREPDGWWLEISWRVHNDEDRPLYLVVTGPAAYEDTDPLLLDHTIREPDPYISPLTSVPFSFREIPARRDVDLPQRYALPAWDFREPRRVIGRFGVGTERPEENSSWEIAAAWQTVVESEPISIGAGG